MLLKRTVPEEEAHGFHQIFKFLGPSKSLQTTNSTQATGKEIKAQIRQRLVKGQLMS